MYRQILQQYWGYSDFRGIQRDIIESIGAGKDTLGLMPTGGGKSITFQVPALAKEGVCIVVTPLIALMKDQVMNLRKRGILAAAVYSGMSHQEIIKTLENCILGNTKLLYISPERLATQLFQQKLAHMKVSFITVDEAHCISQWGYDFRPSYLSIADIRKIKPGIPILALTATATKEVVDDIQDQLGFKEKNVFKMSFERSNLTYVVRETSDKDKELIHILKSVPGVAIVYTRSRRGTKEVAQLLCDNGLEATFYHAGLENVVRDQRQQQWQNDEVRIMVATNAFGMGIDKPDVRIVVHYDCPDSIEAYFQEAGRAGRDGNHSWAVLMHSPSDDRRLRKHLNYAFPPKEKICDIYEHLAYYFQVAMGFGNNQTYTFDLHKFCFTYLFYPTIVDSALRILQNSGYLEYDTDPDTKARLRFLLERDELYRLNDMTEKEDKVIAAILRLYSGLFIDYAYIDEALIAMTTDLDRNEVYMILQVLNKRRIIHFVPQRKMPIITYRTERIDIQDIIIPPEAYEYRRQQMERKINAVIEYANNCDECRSRQLLRYFGDNESKDCGRCDVCVSKKKLPTESSVETATEAIKQMLSDREWHKVAEMNNIILPKSHKEKALRQLVEEEKITTEGNQIRLK